jgi:hypothetical protein
MAQDRSTASSEMVPCDESDWKNSDLFTHIASWDLTTRRTDWLTEWLAD